MYENSWNDEDDYVWQDRTGPYFSEDMELYRTTDGYPCQFVSVPFIRVDYRSLEQEQLDYYLYWRSEFRKGRMLRTCEGYLWILANEIGTGKDDPRRTYGLLMQLWDERKTDLYDPSLFASFVRDYAIENSLPQPSDPVFGADRNEVLADNISCSPMFCLDHSDVRELSGITDVPDRDEFARLFTICLRRLLCGEDALQRMSGGLMIENVRDLYQDYPLIGRRRVIVDSPVLYHSDTFREMCSEVGRCLLSIIDNGNRPDDIDPVMFDMISEISCGEDTGPEMRLSATVTAVRNAGPGEMPRGIHSASDISERDPSTVHVMTARAYERPCTASMIASNWNRMPDRPVPYTESKYVNASYSTFSDAQRSYYIYWRRQAMEGRYLETDTGYIRMFCADLISCCEDCETAAGVIRGMLSFYGSSEAARNILTGILTGYFMTYGIPADRFLLNDEATIGGVAYRCLSENPFIDLPPMCISYLSGISLKEIMSMGDEGIVAFNESLRMIEKERTALGVPRITEYFPVQLKNCLSFPELRYDYPLYSVRGTYVWMGVKRNSAMRAFMSATVRLTEMYIDRMRGKRTKIREPRYHGPRTMEIIEGCVKRAMGITPERRRITLDREALKAAEEDLDAVTGMMASADDAEADAPAEADVPDADLKKDDSDPWRSFLDSLDENEKIFLRDLLSGRDTGRNTSATEDSINSKAADTIGDTIIENGTAVEDYAEDLRIVLEEDRRDEE